MFEQITAANVKRRLAIVLDNRVYSAPVIQERIGGGRASITGNFDIKEARDLSIVLRAGALPAPVEIAEERTVGPSLGPRLDQSRNHCRSSSAARSWCVFMIAYYKGAGLVAVVAVVFNVFFMIAMLAGFQAVLTLPGIAGIVLTVGMAVDANVLINERIREELRAGRAVRSAIEAGYQKCAAGDFGFQRHDVSFRRHPFSVWHRADQRIRRDALHRHPHHRDYRGLSDADLL